jgi:hypothetical protein
MKLGTCLLGGVLLLVPDGAADRALAGPDKPKPEKVVWGKEVNGLAVSLSPAGEGKGRFVVRWKNVGKEVLEVPWVRFGSDRAYKHLDDLWQHVFLKGPDGALVPARKYKFPIIGGPPYRPRTVILEPGKIHQETIDLWTYLDRPAKEGRYQLWIEPDIKGRFAPSREGARFWGGKVRSNTVEVKLPG